MQFLFFFHVMSDPVMSLFIHSSMWFLWESVQSTMRSGEDANPKISTYRILHVRTPRTCLRHQLSSDRKRQTRTRSKEQSKRQHLRTKDQKLHAEQEPEAARRTTTTIKASGSKGNRPKSLLTKAPITTQSNSTS